MQNAIVAAENAFKNSRTQENLDAQVVVLQKAIHGLEITYEGLSLLTKQFIKLNGENKGLAKSMVSKLEAAKSSELRGNENARDDQLNAYKTQITAQKGKALTEEQVDLLL